ncbi:hypothetical protein B0H16DRAFT_1618745 [Mycena metata]|uniref:Fungal-type protein kinase domain-containing protein n=1 Tax=Mycena metata TaxID=1033252 RepID=A0AAD7H896_9AGAR|nr:hypothetical protein B0H16DRAFT_1618745 [Mycena metata]
MPIPPDLLLMPPNPFKTYWPDIACTREHIMDSLVTHTLRVQTSSSSSSVTVFGLHTSSSTLTSLSRRRVLRLIVSEALSRVQDQPTPQLGISLVLEAMRCHHALWIAGIHRTDISLENVMMRIRRTPNRAPHFSGIFNDWDLAPSVNSVPARTGTIPFMHPELLTEEYWAGKIPPLYLHANTSFIWLMAFLVLRYENGKIIPLPSLPFDDLITSNYNKARRIKFDVSRLRTFSCPSGAEQEWAVVLDLLFWTARTAQERSHVLTRAEYRNNLEDIQKLLTTDDALAVCDKFWEIVKGSAMEMGLDYLITMHNKR